MGNLIKKVKEVNFNNEDFIVTSDMQSIEVFKELTGQSFLMSIAKISNMDDELILNLAAATVRRKETPDIVLGKELFNDYEIFSILLNFSAPIVEILGENMPQAKNLTEKK